MTAWYMSFSVMLSWSCSCRSFNCCFCRWHSRVVTVWWTVRWTLSVSETVQANMQVTAHTAFQSTPHNPSHSPLQIDCIVDGTYSRLHSCIGSPHCVVCVMDLAMWTVWWIVQAQMPDELCMGFRSGLRSEICNKYTSICASKCPMTTLQ